jgi:hypothetical protein
MALPILWFSLAVSTLLAAQPSLPDQPFYGPAFELSVAPMRPVLEQGGSVAVTVNLNGSSPAGFQLSYAGVPASVVANTTTATPGANTIIFRCAPDTPPGVYALQVTAAAGQNRQTQTFAFVIRPAGGKEPQ